MLYERAHDTRRTLCVFRTWALVSEHAYLARNYLEGLIYHRADLHTVDESLNIDSKQLQCPEGKRSQSQEQRGRYKISGVDLH